MFNKLTFEQKVTNMAMGRVPKSGVGVKKTRTASAKSTSPKGKSFLGMRDSQWYQAGVWPMAIVSSVIGLASNIAAAVELATPQKVEQKPNGYYQKSYNGSSYYNSESYKERKYQMTANQMRPYLRAAADPRKAAITFGMPWFF